MQTAVNGGSELLIFVPPTAHNHDLAHMMAANASRYRACRTTRQWAQLVVKTDQIRPKCQGSRGVFAPGVEPTSLEPMTSAAMIIGAIRVSTRGARLAGDRDQLQSTGITSATLGRHSLGARSYVLVPSITATKSSTNTSDPVSCCTVISRLRCGAASQARRVGTASALDFPCRQDARQCWYSGRTCSESSSSCRKLRTSGISSSRSRPLAAYSATTSLILPMGPWWMACSAGTGSTG